MKTLNPKPLNCPKHNTTAPGGLDLQRAPWQGQEIRRCCLVRNALPPVGRKIWRSRRDLVFWVLASRLSLSTLAARTRLRVLGAGLGHLLLWIRFLRLDSAGGDEELSGEQLKL